MNSRHCLHENHPHYRIIATLEKPTLHYFISCGELDSFFKIVDNTSYALFPTKGVVDIPDELTKRDPRIRSRFIDFHWLGPQNGILLKPSIHPLPYHVEYQIRLGHMINSLYSLAEEQGWLRSPQQKFHH